jgi:ATP-dependent Clp protease ATP-binding subunit ClpB
MEQWDNNLNEKNEQSLKNEIFMFLRKTLKPEFLNRVDEIVMFKPLNKLQIREIVKMELQKIELSLAGFNMKFEVTEKAIDWLAEKGYDPQLGARPVKRLIQKEIINELSKEIIGGKIQKDKTIVVDNVDDKIIFI